MGRFHFNRLAAGELGERHRDGLARRFERLTAKRNSFQIWVNCQMITTRTPAARAERRTGRWRRTRHPRARSPQSAIRNVLVSSCGNGW